MLWDRKSLGVKQKRDRQPNSHPPGRHSCLRKGTRNSSSRRQALNYETQRLASWGAELTSAAVCAPMYAQKAHVCVVGRHVRVLASRARRRIDSQANRSNYKCYLSTTIKFLQGNQNGVSGHEGESSPRVPFTGAGHGSLPSSASPSAALSSAPPPPGSRRQASWPPHAPKGPPLHAPALTGRPGSAPGLVPAEGAGAAHSPRPTVAPHTPPSLWTSHCGHSGRCPAGSGRAAEPSTCPLSGGRRACFPAVPREPGKPLGSAPHQPRGRSGLPWPLRSSLPAWRVSAPQAVGQAAGGFLQGTGEHASTLAKGLLTCQRALR